MNEIIHVITDVIFIVDQKYIADDETIVKFMLIKDNK